MRVDEAEVRRAFAAALSVRHLTLTARWTPLPHQVPPPGDWQGWLLLAGRGSGKTAACARQIVDHVNGPPCLAGPAPHWIGIIAPTLGDAATACYSGPFGIRYHDPTAELRQKPGGLIVTWPNGSEAKLFGAREPEDPERLRAGGSRCLVWAEELAAWRYLDECFEQMEFGLRAGPSPRWIGSTTPKSRPLIKKFHEGRIRGVVVTRATTFDNPHLPESVREKFVDRYAHRQLGRQELYADLLEADENALWTREALERGRVLEVPPGLVRVSVGVDPSGGAGEQGIVVVGKTLENLPRADGRLRLLPHGYALADRSCRLGPDGWGRRAVQAAIDLEADDIVVEENFGGDMAIATVAGAAEALGVSIPVRKVRASRGKRVRAEPVAALSEGDHPRWHHVGFLEELEAQLCTWTPESGYSPDRLDAEVWPGWHLRIVTLAARGSGSFGGAAVARARIA